MSEIKNNGMHKFPEGKSFKVPQLALTNEGLVHFRGKAF